MSEVAEIKAVAFPQVQTAAHRAAERDVLGQERLRGYATGHAAGMKAAKQAEAELLDQHQAARDVEQRAFARQAGTAMKALGEATRAAGEVISNNVSSAERDVHRLAVELAEAIIGVELQGEEGSARSVLARLRAEPAVFQAVTIRLNPRDVGAVQEAGVANDAELTADDTLAPGDAVVEMVDGLIDMRIGSAIDRIRSLTHPTAGADSSS